MKIKATILTKEHLRQIKEDPNLREMLKKTGINPKRPPYIELNTGGQFDELPQENRENLKGALKIYLGKFARMLIAAVSLDISTPKDKKLFGLDAIKRGLEEMQNVLEFGVSSPDDIPD